MIRKLAAHLVLSTLALLLGVTLVAPGLVSADETEEVECSGASGQTLDEIAGDYIVTEISEPLGDPEESISSGGVNLTEVYWKFSCKDADGHDASRYAAYSSGKPSECEQTECTVVQIIKGSSGTDLLKTYIALIYRWAAGIVGIVAVLVIVISGIQISADQGGGENVTEAKNRIIQSLAGLVILFLSALILYTINPTFFQK